MNRSTNQGSPSIVLTRPVAQSEALERRLKQSGYSVTLFPLLEIAALPEKSVEQVKLDATLANLANYAMAAFVSPNAIHAVFQRAAASRRDFSWPTNVKIAVMGEGSRAALASHGINGENARIFYPSDARRSDSETLLENLDLASLMGKKCVIFRAETGRELLADALTGKGVHVDKVLAYRRFAPQLTAQTGQQLIELMSEPTCWVVSSSEALRTLLDMVERSAGEAGVVKIHQVNLWVSHQRIAETAKNSGFKHIQLIGSGDENVLLALQSHL